MTTSIFMRHVCDHCRRTVESEHEKDKPTMPLGWEMIIVSGTSPLLCPDCVELLREWITTEPEPAVH
jgi:hypothetical protein